MKARVSRFVAIGVTVSAVAAAGCAGAETRRREPSATPVVAMVLPGTEQNFAKEMAAGFAAGVDRPPIFSRR